MTWRSPEPATFRQTELKFCPIFSCCHSSQVCVMKWQVALDFIEKMMNEPENHLVLIQLNTEQTLLMLWLSLILNGLE